MSEGNTIKLNREWRIGSEFARGAFGRIYGAESETGKDVVVKLIPKMPGGERELLFVDLANVPNVIPILDSGECGDSWALVMPRADKSLRQHLVERGGPLPVDEAVIVLIDVLSALIALKDRIVHRDIKPENILLYQGHWCLADFGIARYAEATTGTDTWKHAKTWAYAAPEQWRGERATNATDVYSTGVVAYEMIAGRVPFVGPEEHDFRQQHLEAQPPPIDSCPAALASLVLECLYKAPQARPTPENMLERLQSVQRPASLAAQRLQEVNRAAVEKSAAAEAAASAARSEAEHRRELAEVARASLEPISNELRARIIAAASKSTSGDVWSGDPARWAWGVRLNDAQLTVFRVKRADSGRGEARYPTPFTAIAYSEINIRIRPDQWGYEGRSHSLWFCDAQEEGVFRWYETAFMISRSASRGASQNPFALAPSDKSGVALSNVAGGFRVAWPFTPIDQGQEEEFIERWMSWFADATEGKLRQPRYMPERDPGGSWRQS